MKKRAQWEAGIEKGMGVSQKQKKQKPKKTKGGGARYVNTHFTARGEHHVVVGSPAENTQLLHRA